MTDGETTTFDFLKPRLCGGRFEEGGIPFDMLKDLAVLQEMLIEVAKWRFLEDNPNRVRSPRGFTDGVELRLSRIDEGSVRPVFALSYGSSQFAMLASQKRLYFERARDSIIDAISAAERSGAVLAHLPESSLAYFNRIGRSLRDNEYIELSSAKVPRPARLTRYTRRMLLLASTSVREITEDVNLRGAIPQADQDGMRFDLQLINGQKVSGPIPDQHYATILSAFNGYRNKTRVFMQGVGRYNRQNRLISMESVEHIVLLDKLDVPSRLEEFKVLRDGWLEGEGLAPNHDGLDWLASTFDDQFPNDLPLPYLFPTEDGGVRAEWASGEHSVSLDIDLVNHKAYWHHVNLVSDEDDLRHLDLESQESWAWLRGEIHNTYEDVA